ncbi:PREDICTED: helicase SRCAP [Pseudopodoces humilis]|uniref:helicase SRCAP n=1 Tax=Pseudopodoces humilis TaxID=181119 RepID=UPI0006B82F08|nr:PREDICTED: helicase SRCAP [Pseudopodoces humilis]
MAAPTGHRWRRPGPSCWRAKMAAPTPEVPAETGSAGGGDTRPPFGVGGGAGAEAPPRGPPLPSRPSASSSSAPPSAPPPPVRRRERPGAIGRRPRLSGTVEVECEEEEEGPAHTGAAAQVPAGRMTGSSPVSPASSAGSPGSPSPPGPPRPAAPPEGPPEGPPGPPEPPWLWERSHAEIAEQAKHEAEVEHRVAEMKREGFWSLRRLPKVPEPARPKVHWDYLCEEMQWLAADFAQERRWKRGVARKVVRMVMRHHEEQRQRQERAKREEQAKLRRVAAAIAREVRHFWSSVEKVVQFKQQSRLEEKRKKALDLQLDFIVGQTERYSDLLSRSLNAPRHGARTCTAPAESPPRPLGDLLGALPPQVLRSTRDPPPPWGPREEDEEFAAEEEEGEDEEDTIAAQERLEGDVDHQQELDDLAREGALPMEELLQRYRGAFTDSDCDSAPGASSTRSDSPGGDSEEDEDEEDEEEEEEEDEADDEEDEEEGEGQEGGGGAPGEPGGGVAPPTPAQVPPAPAAAAGPAPKKEISDIAAAAESLQPKGYTLATTQVKTPIPHLLRGTLREYQHIGLDWLVTMYEKQLNGILADEMGLGKTIQTISLLAHLACEKGSWGPHLIIVPTSVMLNWEMELKRWCPSFKILTYYGAQKERRLKRQGWTKPNAFHVCITSYKLVLQDHQAFRRKNWKYLILDEAQNIKNFKSQRWQSLLNFNSQRRLLLTGTPLQNSLMELWSLMHFLMPRVFQSHREFREWFHNPLTGMIEGSQEYNESLVKRLHKVLRPFLLRRLKVDVEKQMPKKYEHVLRCRLSKRQRFLYDDFMGQASTKATLASGHFMSVINVLMQLRKVCNHPDLFEPRPVTSPLVTPGLSLGTPALVLRALEPHPFQQVDLSPFELVALEAHLSRYAADWFLPRFRVTRRLVEDVAAAPDPPPRPKPVRMKVNRMLQPVPKAEPRAVLLLPAPPLPAASLATPTPAGGPAPVATPTPNMGKGAAPAPPPAVATFALPQRLLLAPDMQARLPSGEVVSLGQLAALAQQRPPLATAAGGGAKLQGSKVTLGPSPPLRQLALAPPPPRGLARECGKNGGKRGKRGKTGNVVHLLAAGGAQHLLAPPAQVTLLAPVGPPPAAGGGAGTPTQPPPHLGLPLAAAQVPAPLVNSAGVVKIVVGGARVDFGEGESLESRRARGRAERLERLLRLNELRCGLSPVYGREVLGFLTLPPPALGGALQGAVLAPPQRLQQMQPLLDRFLVAVPAVASRGVSLHSGRPPPWAQRQRQRLEQRLQEELRGRLPGGLLHLQGPRSHFPDPRLVQYDCGKLQALDVLLRRLRAGGHRVLIFTQMTRMLDVLERFLTFHGHIYLRLDGSTRVEQRQALMERFNADKRIFCFILSTRSGGVGVNLAGADTVVFYDSDWNPTMDAQAQDRCHRIGQTRDVHIYRLISERTVEENILKKANQKRLLGDMAIEGGNFTTAYFKQQTIRELFDMAPEERERDGDGDGDRDGPAEDDEDPAATRRTHILEQALCGAEDPEDIRAASQAQAEHVAALAEFSESLSPEEGGAAPEGPEEELSKAEQEIAALVEQLTPIERYAMNFLEASLEDVSREELKQAEGGGGAASQEAPAGAGTALRGRKAKT